ncbi:30S ribosomal protein S4 [Candidatus Pacearchaeota archaeon]|nr:30S ribosomal protein S4 [Candidatus Pacearchaeota archaeon]
MIRSKKKYSRPRRPFDKTRIDEEAELKKKYGLKNKREIWKADGSIREIRSQAKKLITAPDEEKKAFIERLQKKGFGVASIADSLSLDKEDLMKRRLQTIVFKKGLANTPKQARQLIAHKHVSIGDQVVNKPSYVVKLEEENLIKLRILLKTEKSKPKTEEIKDEVLEAEKEIAEDIAEGSGAAGREEEKVEKEIIEDEVEKVEKGKEDIEKAEEKIAKKITKEKDKAIREEEKAEEDFVEEKIKETGENKNE